MRRDSLGTIFLFPGLQFCMVDLAAVAFAGSINSTGASADGAGSHLPPLTLAARAPCHPATRGARCARCDTALAATCCWVPIRSPLAQRPTSQAVSPITQQLFFLDFYPLTSLSWQKIRFFFFFLAAPAAGGDPMWLARGIQSPARAWAPNIKIAKNFTSHSVTSSLSFFFLLSATTTQILDKASTACQQATRSLDGADDRIGVSRLTPLNCPCLKPSSRGPHLRGHHEPMMT